ncbi:MAG: precorrin-3B C(17)-methyltransferase [Lachnospiraceae bacterium]|nr:precorrin-3B C(17)-methyltransferase [Lachnospiraceae bacterium]MDY2758602.1 precorrin-3B C(17)-methyltransferase [Lachnospiraceae bacterium]
MKKITIVGIGPGGYEDMTVRAINAIKNAEVVTGYRLYLGLVKDLIGGKETFCTEMRGEVERCQKAAEYALSGRNVVLISSGDAGIYGMAGLMLKVLEDHPEVETEVIAGVSACQSGGAVLGAPLVHDFAVISLSDLLTPWDLIEKRLAAAAGADFVIVLYNPGSHKRADYLSKACDILLQYKSPDTVCGLVKNISRDGEEHRLLTLRELRDTRVDMLTTVFIGNSHTSVVNGKMVTPRGYVNSASSSMVRACC